MKTLRINNTIADVLVAVGQVNYFLMAGSLSSSTNTDALEISSLLFKIVPS